MATAKEPALGRLPHGQYRTLRRAVVAGPAPPRLLAPPDPPTPSQAAFLASLSPDQAGSLERNPTLRDEVLEWFHDGPDPILEAEALRRLSLAEDPAEGI